ncbi:MAG: NAD(P)/FAD-dependent oxidoreductase [Acidobacteriota bacterium]
MNQKSDPHFQVIIIGSGFSGLGTAIRLKQDGINDFIILERANDVGGTWRDNTYPGCACDVQSHLYSFSFAPNPNWSRMYSPQAEIWAYLQHCARDYGLIPHIRFQHEVRNAIWQERAQHWRVETSQGVYTASLVVAGIGALSEPSIPRLPGIETFMGKTFHSARWDHEYDLTNRKVAVIGTGASAIQFVPEIQPKVGALKVFQRTPPWIVPRIDRAISAKERRIFNKFPLAQQLTRFAIYWLREFFLLCFRHPRLSSYFKNAAIRHLNRAVKDPVLRAKLTPNYTIGCKRILLSNNYLPSLTQSNVEVITEHIREIRPHAIVTEDGIEREIDTIIYGTGFHVTDIPLAKHITGKHGLTLAETWRGSPKAYLGTTISGFPNFFLLLGPNTGLGHTSVVFMIESQIAHVISVIRYIHKHNIAAIEPRLEAQATFLSEVDKKMRGTVWTAGGCKSWYLDATGRNSTLWPTFTWQFRHRAARLIPSDYLMSPISRQESDCSQPVVLNAEATQPY